jgi:transcriptional regulator with XRE-family HTH domain
MADEITGRDLIRRQLKRLREAQGLSIRQLADELTWSKSMIGDVESGHRLPKAELVAALDAYFRPVLSFAELLDNVRDALIAEHMKELLPHEKEAVRIQFFSSSAVPGLLQTEPYAWALTRKSLPGASDSEISARVSLRIDRQQVLVRPEAPYCWGVIDEAVLTRPLAAKGAMLDQLQHLEQFAANPRNTFQIVPNIAGLHGFMGGSLALWTLKDGRTVALVESFGSGEPIETPTRVMFYSEMFDEVKINALSPDDSLDLLRLYIKDCEK